MNIYKILRQDEWEAFRESGIYPGSAHDQRDGFIHFSTREQTPGTLAKHYADTDHVVIISVDADGLENDLKWEVSRGGAHFPHLYAALSYSDVKSVWQIENKGAGFDLAAFDEDA